METTAAEKPPPALQPAITIPRISCDRTFDLLEVRVDIDGERRMLPQAIEMREGPGVSRVTPHPVEDRREASSFEHVSPCSLVREERELGDEADVGESDLLADQEVALRKERQADPAEIGGECIPGSRLNLGRNGSIEQRQQVRLRIASEDETRVEEAVHARRLVRILPVEREASLAEPGDRSHDAVRLEDADGAVRAERGRDGAERMRFEKGAGLPQLHSFEAGSTDLLARGLGFVGRRERPSVEVPEPGLKLGRRRSADFDVDAA